MVARSHQVVIRMSLGSYALTNMRTQGNTLPVFAEARLKPGSSLGRLYKWKKLCK